MNFRTDLLQSNCVAEDELGLLFLLPPPPGRQEMQVCTPMPVLYDARDRTQSLDFARQTLYQLTIPPAQIIPNTWEKLSRNAWRK